MKIEVDKRIVDDDYWYIEGGVMFVSQRWYDQRGGAVNRPEDKITERYENELDSEKPLERDVEEDLEDEDEEDDFERSWDEDREDDEEEEEDDEEEDDTVFPSIN